MTDLENTMLSDQICNFISGMADSDVPDSTLWAAKRVLLDATGVMLGASGLAREADPFVALARMQGSGPSTILGTGIQVPASAAALANGAFAHALDFEDAFDLSPGHPNASLVPALIALAQSEGPVAGGGFLAALAIGCDVSCRMGLALQRSMEVGGWYPPPMQAGYGASMGAARLLGLNADQMRDTLSIMLCQNTMPGEIKYSAGTVLRAVREAFPAQAAVNSALLAREGVRGFEQPIEGRAGFYALYAGGEFSEEVWLDKLGERFWIEQLTFKAWPSCRGTHPFIEMALGLREEYNIQADQIAEIVVSIDAVQTMLVEPYQRKQAPETVIDAKFSIPFTTALALEKGTVRLSEFGDKDLGDPAILALAAKVRAQPITEPTWQRGSGGAITIKLTNGRMLEASQNDARGCPARPLSDAELVDKFVECAGKARNPMKPAEARALAERIFALEECSDVGALFA